MGWSKFVIIPPLAIASLEGFRGFGKILMNKHLIISLLKDLSSIENRTIRDLTIYELSLKLMIRPLRGMGSDKLSMFWLRAEAYEIETGIEIDKAKLKEEGYDIQCR